MDWYRDYVLLTGRSGALWMLVGYLVTYALTRWITTTIRRRTLREEQARAAAEAAGTPLPEKTASSTPIKDIHIGGVHVHHQVWGILLVLTSGLLLIRFSPDSPLIEILSALFGVGAALALDEFALWLHLEDVYWSEEGRKSIDAVIIAAVLAIVLLIGTSPIGLVEGDADAGFWALASSLVVHFGAVMICALKGKLITAFVGLPIPFIAIVGAIRLAQPDSFWARRFYRKRPKKLARAIRRDDRYDARYERLRTRVSFSS